MKKLIYYVAIALMFSVNAPLFALTDYVLNGHAQVAAFVAGGTGVRENIGKLTVYGTDVTQTDFNSLADRILSCGTVTFENFTAGTKIDDKVSVSDIGPFFLNVTCKGGIIFRNCKYMVWTNGINKDGHALTHVYGDFIVDNCNFAQPGVDGWAEDLFWGGIVQVDGDFILTHFNNRFVHGSSTGYKLKKVGGNFEISYPVSGGNTVDNACWSYETGFQSLQTVGGNFTINGDNFAVGDVHLKIWSLDCLTNISSIGGDVKIINLPDLGVGGQGSWPYGYCYVRYLIDAGIIDYAHHNVQIGDVKGGTQIDLTTLGGCSDGINPDTNPIALPIKETGFNDLKSSITEISLTNSILTIDSKTDLSKVEVFNLTGANLIQFLNVPAGISSHSISSLQKGVYVIKLTSTDNKTGAYKVIK